MFYFKSFFSFWKADAFFVPILASVNVCSAVVSRSGCEIMLRLVCSQCYGGLTETIQRDFWMVAACHLCSGRVSEEETKAFASLDEMDRTQPVPRLFLRILPFVGLLKEPFCSSSHNIFKLWVIFKAVALLDPFHHSGRLPSRFTGHMMPAASD